MFVHSEIYHFNPQLGSEDVVVPVDDVHDEIVWQVDLDSRELGTVHSMRFIDRDEEQKLEVRERFYGTKPGSAYLRARPATLNEMVLFAQAADHKLPDEPIAGELHTYVQSQLEAALRQLGQDALNGAIQWLES